MMEPEAPPASFSATSEGLGPVPSETRQEPLQAPPAVERLPTPSNPEAVRQQPPPGPPAMPPRPMGPRVIARPTPAQRQALEAARQNPRQFAPVRQPPAQIIQPGMVPVA